MSPACASAQRSDDGEPELPAALRAALAAPGGTPPATRESHSAWVILAGDRAYKLKKPVRFAFLDYSTAPLRRAACEEEAIVNRALAPDLVVGVRGLRRADAGIALCDPDAGDAIDWVIEMRRFDEDHTMAALLERGALTDDLVRAAAARIAAFHKAADAVDDADPAGRVLATIERNVGELVELAPDRAAIAALGAFLLGAARARRDDLAARGRARLVRDGHGDLRTEHVVFEDAGVLIVDRIEFDPALRRIDVGDDLSFLAMDLEARGARGAAGLLLEAYRAVGGDPGDRALLAMFAAHRALVRAKVVLLRGPAARDPRSCAAAASLTALAARLAWRARTPLALIVCGPPASGKSTLAAALSARSGLPVLSSDALRRTGGAPVAGAGARPDGYTPAARAAVYAELGRRTRAALGAGDGVIVDATFGDPALRAAFLGELTPAQRQRVRVTGCRAPLDVLVARAAQPRGGGSEAGPAVARALAHSFHPFTELGAERTIAVEGTQPAEHAVAAIEAWLATDEARRCARVS